MNASKTIDISKSSIIGLKAELLRKQEEVNRLKELQQSYVKPEIVQKKKSVYQNSNEGVERRRAKDTDENEVDYDALHKSREVLEAKSRLYDKLKGRAVDEETKSKYLIDFDLKREIDKEIPTSTAEDKGTEYSENEEGYSDSNSDPENDWVDFVDTLGRSRRCLRKDLPEMRAKDAKLAAALCPPSPPPDTTPTPTPELLSWDMQREMMRRKWEEQETLLLGKKDIHYQDVRFDEARPHGVGYFEFSKDEAERARQQEELQKLRVQTEEQQEAAKGLRARRQQQLQARLAAARQRRRERLGLPPESPPHEAETPTNTNEGEEKECVEKESINDLEESVKKVAPIRPWDIGKNCVAPVMSQEEWIEKKRQERPAEFAPPSSLIKITNPENSIEQKWKSNPNVFTSKMKKQKSLFNEKPKKKKKKNKKSKLDKGEEIVPQDEKEEESFGPSVKDWQAISEENCTVLSGNSLEKVNYFSTDEFSKSSHIKNSHNPTAESQHEGLPGPSVKGWKPSVSDIDLLLSKSRAASHNISLEGSNRNCTLSSGPTISTESRETIGFPSSVHADNLKHECIVSLERPNVVKRTNHDITIASKYISNNQKDSVKTCNESLNKSENSENIIRPICNLLELNSDDEDEESLQKRKESSDHQWKSTKRKFAEIPPPPSMSYYIDGDKKYTQNPSTKPQLADSISAGINYLKSQTEEKNKKRLKGMLDII